MKYPFYILILAIVVMGMTGCSSEKKPGYSSSGARSVTLHEPGVYKGAKDTVLKEQQRQELIDRFRLVQADR